MSVTKSPQQGPGSLTYQQTGKVCVINGVRYDFTALADGARLHRDAITRPDGLETGIVSPTVTGVDGSLRIHLRAPYQDAPDGGDITNPDPVSGTYPDGVIDWSQMKDDATDLADRRARTVAPRAEIADRMIANDPTVAAELEAWAEDGTIPGRANAAFVGRPLADRAAAKNTTVIQRNSPLVALFGALYGYTTDAQLDELFGIS